MDSNVPAAVQRARVDGDDAVFIRQLGETGEALHVVGILIHAMQQDYHGIFLLGVVTPGQSHQVSAIDIANRYFFLGFLGSGARSDEGQSQAGCHG
jgi:hypothetical protein